MEGRFRRVLSYPATPATNDTAAVKNLVTSWGQRPRPSAFNFNTPLWTKLVAPIE